MNTKLTLSLDQSIIEAAKKIAKKRNSSLSKMVEEYFYKIMHNTTNENISIPQEIKDMVGVIKLKDDRDYKTIINEEKIKKYLKR